MKLPPLTPVLCALLFACGETETTENASTTHDIGAAPTMKVISFTPDKPAGDATSPKSKTGTIGGRSDTSPTTRIVERAGIDPRAKIVKVESSKMKPVSFIPEISATASIGRSAPDFELKDLTGKLHKLSDYKGKTIVLEWFNPDCPFVKDAHEKGPLKKMFGEYKDKSVVWIAINSGAPDKQGTNRVKNIKSAQDWNMRHPLLFDPTGEVGKTYKAKTTPHMYVIDKDFYLKYSGALDNAPMSKTKGEYKNYVKDSIDAISKDEPCPKGDKPYGCGVKYAG